MNPKSEFEVKCWVVNLFSAYDCIAVDDDTPLFNGDYNEVIQEIIENICINACSQADELFHAAEIKKNT